MVPTAERGRLRRLRDREVGHRDAWSRGRVLL